MGLYIRTCLLALLLTLATTWTGCRAATSSVIVKPFPLLRQLPSATVNCVYRDRNGIMWIGTKSGVCRYDGYRIQTFRSGLRNPNLLVSNDVLCVAEDNRYYYIGTRKGLNLMDKQTFHIKTLPFDDLNTEIRAIMPDRDGQVWVGTYKRLVRLSADLRHCERCDQHKLPATSVNSLIIDAQGQLWVMFWKAGLWRYDRQASRFVKMPQMGNSDNPFHLFQDNHRRYWITTWGEGLYTMDGHGHIRKAHYAPALGNKIKSVYSIVQDDKYGYLWTVGQYGFVMLKPHGDSLEEVAADDITRQMSHFFNAIYKDPDGTVWISAFNTGIYQLRYNELPFVNTPLDNICKQYGLDTDIRALFTDRDGDEWLSQQGMGLCLLRTNGKFDAWPSMASLAHINNLSDIAFICQPTFLPEGHVWVATLYERELWELEKDATTVRAVKIYDFDKIKLGNLQWYLEDACHNVWVSTKDGIAVKPAGRNFMRTGLDLADIYTMTEPTPGEIWMGSRTQGIYKVNYKNTNGTVRITGCRVSNSRNTPLPTNHIEALATDTRRGKVWIGLTEGLLFCHDLKTHKTENLSKYFEGIIQQEIINVTTDKDGNVWITTTASLIKYDPTNHNVSIYSTGDQIAVTAYAKNAYSYFPTTGRFYFAGTGGIVSIDPRKASRGKARPTRPVVSDVKISGQSVFSGLLGDAYRLDDTQRHISLGRDARNIEIDFTACNYRNPGKTVYAYKLEGVDREWTYTSEGRVFAYYNDLPKGRHKLLLKATDANGQWSNNVSVYTVYRQPHLYETWWAYTLYILATATAALYLYKNGKRRLKEREQLRITKIEKEKDEELTQTKLRYFTNVSHDFLTPITVISCIIDDMKMSIDYQLPQLDQIKVNLDKLKQLIQQVLDFRKIDNGKMHLKVTEGDLAEFLADLCRNYFEPMVQKKHIAFGFQTCTPHIQAWFDHDKVEKIMINLLSNAFKYTAQGDINVTVNLQEDSQGRTCAAIAVKDTGKGMKAEELSHIFERFYTSQQRYDSNGIGLSLVKELADLHHASVSVDSHEGQGSTFTLLLPIDRSTYTDDETDRQPTAADHDRLALKAIKREADETAPDNTADDKTLLIVEDNEELLILMEHIFSRYHQVMKAANGQEALQAMKSHEPDLIISDVMMPVMDGLTLCRQLKNDVDTSHIPIILLTARNTPEDRAECYDAGADGYVAKPFELNVLKARIDNFLRTRHKQQADFRTDEKPEADKLEISTLDKRLIDRLMALIEEHLADEDFDVINLAEAMCMSKSTLYRKLKSITGLSTVEFIRNIRLKHAYQKLLSEETSITDIAFACGFSSLRYFSKCFKEEFGVTPTDLRKTN